MDRWRKGIYLGCERKNGIDHLLTSIHIVGERVGRLVGVALLDGVV